MSEHTITSARPKRVQKRVRYGENSDSDLETPPPKRSLRPMTEAQRSDVRIDSADVYDTLTSCAASENGPIRHRDEQEDSAKVAMKKTTVTRDLWDSEKNEHGQIFMIPAPEKVKVEHRKIPLVLPRLDLAIILQPENTIGYSRLYIIDLIRSVDTLPVLKQWADMWMNAEDEVSKAHHDILSKAFKPSARPWTKQIDIIAAEASKRADNNKKEQKQQFSGYIADHAVTIVKKQWGPIFRHLSFANRADNEHYKFAVRLLLTVFDDIRTNEQGFFGTLFKSELGEPNVPEIRKVYEKCYVVDPNDYEDEEALERTGFWVA